MKILYISRFGTVLVQQKALFKAKPADPTPENLDWRQKQGKRRKKSLNSYIALFV